MTKQYDRHPVRSRRGMAMLMVLFIVMAIAIISTGFIARSDAALQCGTNYALKTQTDYLAWAGLEHARALVTSPEYAVPMPGWSGTALGLDASDNVYYDLTLDAPAAAGDPNTYTYTVHSSAYLKTGSDIRARSNLQGTLYYAPDVAKCYYRSVTRP